MKITFGKRSRARHVISCSRADGTVTWMHSDDFYIQHDLLHYAVETTLRYNNAFYGMLASGIDISSFEGPRNQRPFITEEAMQAEHIVGFVALELKQGEVANWENVFAGMVHHSNPQLPVPAITRQQIQQIKDLYNSLLQQWHEVPDEKTMTLSF